MYVCVCNAIRVSELRAAARDFTGDAEELYITLGRPPQCGQCLEDAIDILNQERQKTKLPVCVPN